jgi:hypothetical protein
MRLDSDDLQERVFDVGPGRRGVVIANGAFFDTVVEPIRDSGAIKRRRRVILERSTSVQPKE